MYFFTTTECLRQREKKSNKACKNVALPPSPPHAAFAARKTDHLPHCFFYLLSDAKNLLFLCQEERAIVPYIHPFRPISRIHALLYNGPRCIKVFALGFTENYTIPSSALSHLL